MSDGKCPDIYECRMGVNKILRESIKLQARVKELEAELTEVKSCPNESWECAKEQRRLEAENARLRTRNPGKHGPYYCRACSGAGEEMKQWKMFKRCLACWFSPCRCKPHVQY